MLFFFFSTLRSSWVGISSDYIHTLLYTYCNRQEKTDKADKNIIYYFLTEKIEFKQRSKTNRLSNSILSKVLGKVVVALA